MREMAQLFLMPLLLDLMEQLVVELCGIMTILIITLFHIGINQHPLILMVFLVIGSFTFSQLGISVAFWAKTFDQLSAVSGFVLLPLIYLGGVLILRRKGAAARGAV